MYMLAAGVAVMMLSLLYVNLPVAIMLQFVYRTGSAKARQTQLALMKFCCCFFCDVFVLRVFCCTTCSWICFHPV